MKLAQYASMMLFVGLMSIRVCFGQETDCFQLYDQIQRNSALSEQCFDAWVNTSNLHQLVQDDLAVSDQGEAMAGSYLSQAVLGGRSLVLLYKIKGNRYKIVYVYDDHMSIIIERRGEMNGGILVVEDPIGLCHQPFNEMLVIRHQGKINLVPRPIVEEFSLAAILDGTDEVPSYGFQPGFFAKQERKPCADSVTPKE
jgi:hypothetical protein